MSYLYNGVTQDNKNEQTETSAIGVNLATGVNFKNKISNENKRKEAGGLETCYSGAAIVKCRSVIAVTIIQSRYRIGRKKYFLFCLQEM